MNAPHAALAIRQLSRNTGAVRTAYDQIEALRALGFRVTVLAESAQTGVLRQYGAEWVKIHRWPFRGYSRRRWFDRCVQRWKRRQAPELFVSHGDAYSDDVLVMHNCVELAHERIRGTMLPKQSELRRLQEHVLAGSPFRLLVANSELMQRDFVKRYGIPIERTRVVYPGVDRGGFNHAEHARKRAAGRALAAVESEVPLIGLVTSGDLEKRNVGFFLRLVATLKPRLGCDARYLLLGRRSKEHAKYARKLGIEDQMVFIHQTSEVENIYHALDVFVLPAHIEEFGRVVLEALSCGTPAVVSSNVGASELMTKAGLGDVIADYSLEQWAAAVQRLMASAELRRERSAAAVCVANQYSREQQKKVLVETFSSLSHAEAVGEAKSAIKRLSK